MGGCDPVIVRRLGQPEQEAVVVNHLGINYHLDSYLDEDMQRFAVEFPQCFQVMDGGCGGRDGMVAVVVTGNSQT